MSSLEYLYQLLSITSWTKAEFIYSLTFTIFPVSSEKMMIQQNLADQHTRAQRGQLLLTYCYRASHSSVLHIQNSP